MGKRSREVRGTSSDRRGVQRYEYRGTTRDGGRSEKFWEPQLEGSAFTVRFGKIGTDGQVQRKMFASAAKAEAAFLAAVREKLLKGYKPAAAKFTAERLPEPPVSEARVIAACYVGEHTFDAAFDLAAWLTACLHHGVTPQQFRRTWGRFTEGDDGLEFWYNADAVSATAMGGKRSQLAFDAEADECWEDMLEEDVFDIDQLYARAVECRATRFVVYDNEAYCSVIAVRGDPGAQALKELAHAAEDVRVSGDLEAALAKESAEDAELRTREGVKEHAPIVYPRALAPGAPIAWIDNGSAWLRDGKRIKFAD